MAGSDVEAQTGEPPETAPPKAPHDNDNELLQASISEVFSFGKGTRTRLFLGAGLVCAGVSGCIYPALAFYYAKGFKDLGASTSGNDFLATIRSLAFTFMTLGAIVFTSMAVQNTLLETVAGEMTVSLKTSWFDALLRQDLAYYDIKDVSGTAAIISTNGAQYKKGVGRKLGEGIQFLVTFVGGLGYAFYASWRASLVILTVVPFMAVSVFFLVKVNQSQTASANASYGDAGSIVYSAVASIRTIFSLNAVESTIAKFVDATAKAYHDAVSQVHLLGLANGSMMGSFLLSYIALTLYGSFLLYDAVRETGCDPSGTVEGNYECNPSAADVYGALMGMTFAAAVLPQVSVAIEAMTGARTACYPAIVAMNRRLENDEQNQKSSVPDKKRSLFSLPKYVIDSSSPAGKKPSTVNGQIEFQDVTFSYPTRREADVLNGFSLKVEVGKTVAIVGPSGSGKSTIVQLIERFYDPIGGSIMLDGIDLRELNVKWLRQLVGLVSQEPRLFACSISENIAYGCPGASREQIEDAAKMANAHDFIMSFPSGYETQVGDQGAKLSGGQKQRIAIARVLVKNPKILLLDEATSALDSESESLVQGAIDRLLGENRTTIVIAHRLSTIRNADLIAVVDGGKVIETGTHTELISRRGHYFQLVDAQKTRSSEQSDPVLELSARIDGVVDLQDLEENEVTTPVLRLRNVSFCYPARPNNYVFKDFNLSVRPGETMALVGPSGHGKSTTIQLIERFYDPTEGSVEFYGIDLKDLNLKWLRSQLGLVSQEPTLFDTSIANNIRYGCPDATQEQIEDAARQANAHDFIVSFPDGYDTPVGEGGTQVSGGQKQRIAIARALLSKPSVLLFDEATSALDSESERVVQEALDAIMETKSQTTIVIAHRLSTIRKADRIAVIANGRVREVGTHDELMARPHGHYRRLQAFQNLAPDRQMKLLLKSSVSKTSDSAETLQRATQSSEREFVVDKLTEQKNARRARLLASDDRKFFFIGGVGALLAGLVFPSWGFIFAYMIQLLYTPVSPCGDGVALPPENFSTCEEYYDFVADDMQQLSFKVAGGFAGIIVTTMIGNMLLFYGFGTASEKMNKRVRDAAFISLLRQEVGFFDLRPVGTITSQLQEDAALIHSFSGEPIRSLVMNLSSVLVGILVSFAYMWPFALLMLTTVPFMIFGAETEMRMYFGGVESDDSEEGEHSPGGIVVETLMNIRTVASLCIETRRSTEYANALHAEDPRPLRSNFVKGMSAGLGQLIQMWACGLMLWWGGWLLLNYPDQFEYRDFLISMFALLFSLSGTAVAVQGTTDRDKAKLAAARIFELTDRKSAIDSLSNDGKKI